MNRRTFIESLGWGVLPLAMQSLHGARKPAFDGNRSESIIVIGAGVAGIAAARTLVDQGYDRVTVLEGRDRVGGRVWTSQHWPDAPMDLGASWIHGPRGNPIKELARQAEARTVRTDWNNVVYFDSDGEKLSGKRATLLDRLSREVDRTLSGSNQNQGKTLQVLFDQLAVGRTGAERKLIDFLVNAAVEQELATNAHELSAKAFNWGKEFRGGDVLFPSGYWDVFAPLVAGLDIRTNHVVREVAMGSDGVRIETNQGSFSADRVVVTLPLGVLQKGAVQFTPNLPVEKGVAMSTLGMGVLNKVYLRFEEVFWPSEQDGFSYLSSQKGRWSQWLDLHRPTGKPILLAFNAATFGREIESWPNAKIIDEAMVVLRRIFGERTPSPIDYQITRWGQDPFAFGSYSTLGPGITEGMVKTLANPVADRLFFAGEATSLDFPSTVHGAYLSGIREAERITKLGLPRTGSD